MDNKKLEEIAEKTKDAQTFAEAKAILTPDEMIYYLIAYGEWAEEMCEGDECLVAEAIKILASKGYSARHLLHLLDVAKDTVLSLARVDI